MTSGNNLRDVLPGMGVGGGSGQQAEVPRGPRRIFSKFGVVSGTVLSKFQVYNLVIQQLRTLFSAHHHKCALNPQEGFFF